MFELVYSMKFKQDFINVANFIICSDGERGGSVVECRALEREVGGSKPTSTVLCP